jgi:hypothetical protein
MAISLVLDASVCCDLANFHLDRGKPEHLASAQILLLTILETGVDVLPFQGCLELASPFGHTEATVEKLWSFGSNVYATLCLSREHLLARRSVPSKQCGPPDMEWVSAWRSLQGVLPILRFFYGAMLKILELRARPDLEKNVIENILAFVSWCERLRCHIALATHSAIALLSGSHEAKGLLRVRKGRGPLRTAWGAAWDLCHSWLVQNFYSTVRIDGSRQHPIFVTADQAAAFVAGRCATHAVLSQRGTPSLSVSGLSLGYPYLAGRTDALHQALDAIQETQLHRLAQGAGGPRFDPAALDAEIARLETSLAERHPGQLG